MRLNLFVPITKIDTETRTIFGRAVAQELDRAGEVFHYETSKPFFEAWSGNIAKATDGKSVGNLRAMHGKVAAGKLTDIAFEDDQQAIDVAAKVVDDGEWTKCLEGVYSGLSIGGKYVKRWSEKSGEGDTAKSTKYYTADPAEVSLVDYPAGPSATFQIVKAAGEPEIKKFREPDAIELKARELCKADGGDPDEEVEAGGNLMWKWQQFVSAAQAAAKAAAPAAKADPVAPTNDQVAAAARVLAKEAGDESKWSSFIEKARDVLTKAGDIAPAAPDRTRPDPETIALAKDIGAVQVWTHSDLPGKTFAKKADLISALTQAGAEKTAADAARPLLDVLGDITKSLDGKDGGIEQQTMGGFFAAEASKHDEAVRIACEIVPDVWKRAAAFAKANPDHVTVQAVAKSPALQVAKKDGMILKIEPATIAAVKAVADASGWVRKKDYSADKRQQMAKAGEAMKDGALPIADKGDLEDAIAAYGGVTNKTAARRHVAKRARALGASDMLPADWPGSAKDAKKFADTPLAKAAPDDLRKAASLSSITTLVYLLADLDRAEEMLESPIVSDPYYSPYTIATTAIEVPKALRDAFGALVVNLGDCVAELLDALLNAIKEEEASEALEMAAPIVGLMKAGARHSKGDTALINQVHDVSVKLGASCESGATKGAEADDLQKMVEAERREFTKMIGGVTSVVTEIAKRVKAIEDTPMPRPGGSDQLRVVDKAHDTVLPLTPEQAEKHLADPTVLGLLATEAIKLAQRMPNSRLPSI